MHARYAAEAVHAGDPLGMGEAMLDSHISQRDGNNIVDKSTVELLELG